MKRVMFIHPPLDRLMGYTRYYLHQGLLSLATVVHEAGHEVMVYDADYNIDGVSFDAVEKYDNFYSSFDVLNDSSNVIWKEIAEMVDRYKPDYVGITVLTPAIDSVKKVIEIVRGVNPSIKIIVGGTHVSLCPEDLSDLADYSICFEGEDAILQILDGNIDRKIIYGDRIQDINKLPMPKLDLFYNLEQYKKRDLSLLISGRGCPNGCKFCDSPQIWKRKVTRKTTDRFVSEIEMIKSDYGVNDFYISDDSFMYDRKWLMDFCDKVKKDEITWRCLGRVDQVVPETLDKMHEAGCRHLKLGIESGSQRILDMVNKNLKIDEVLRVSELLEKSKMDWSAFFMIGFPGETEEDIRKTQELMKNLSAKSITVSIFTPSPGCCLLPPEKLKGIDYQTYSHHSPKNNFTGTIEDEKFHELVKETLNMSVTGYVEHNVFEE